MDICHACTWKCSWVTYSMIITIRWYTMNSLSKLCKYSNTAISQLLCSCIVVANRFSLTFLPLCACFYEAWINSLFHLKLENHMYYHLILNTFLNLIILTHTISCYIHSCQNNIDANNNSSYRLHCKVVP